MEKGLKSSIYRLIPNSHRVEWCFDAGQMVIRPYANAQYTLYNFGILLVKIAPFLCENAHFPVLFRHFHLK